MRVCPTVSSQPYIEGAFSIKPRSAELLCVDVDVEEITFNRGFYTVDVKYYYKIRGTVFPGGYDITGLSIFDKRVILFGSEGNAKIFTSNGPNCLSPCFPGVRSNLPIAVVEAVDPIALGMKVVDSRHCEEFECELHDIPEYISAAFGEELALSGAGKRVYVTLGQFSIIRLERETQLMMPAYDYCMPEKDCIGSSEEDPCTLFGKIRFPVEEFFPPDNISLPEDYQGVMRNMC